MLISQFRKFTPINIAILCAIGILFAFFVSIAGDSIPEISVQPFFGDFLQNYFFSTWDFSIPTFWEKILTLICILIQALFLNKITNFYKILGKPNFLIALIFVTLSFFVVTQLSFSPIYLVNLIFIYILFRMMKLYHIEKAYFDTFHLGFLIGISSLIYLPAIFNFLAIWIALLLFRPFSWREWFTPLLGLVTVYFLSWVYGFWFGMNDSWQSFFQPFGNLQFPDVSVIKTRLRNYWPLIPIFIILLFFLNVIKNTFFKRIVHVRKSLQLMLAVLLINLVSFFANSKLDSMHFILCLPVLSVYLSYYFHNAEKKWVYESLYGLLLASILYTSVV